MSAAKLLAYAASTLISIFLVGAGYYLYRAAQVPEFATVTNPGDFFQASGYTCRFSWGNFQNGGSGSLFVYHNKLLAIYDVTTGAAHHRVHLLANEEKVLAWSDDFDKMYSSSFTGWLSEYNLSSPRFEHLACTPWYFPSDGVFVDVNGEAIQ